MTLAQKVLTTLGGIALVTTLILPDRQTAKVINALTGLIKGSFSTVMGTAK